jgi:hypothetical protein
VRIRLAILCALFLAGPGIALSQAVPEGDCQPGRPMGLFGPYLGQKPPGTTPVLFGAGIPVLTVAMHYGCGFTPDGREFYFNRGGATLMVSRLGKDGWTCPEPAPFAAGYGSREPHVSVDGRHIYWNWNHPLPPGVQGPVPAAVWAVDRTGQGWSDPHFMGSGMFVSTTLNGEIYTTSVVGVEGLARVRVEDGRFKSYEPVRGGMDALVTEATNPAHPCIAPDGSYLVFDADQGNHLYVCFKQKDGAWGPAIDLARYGVDPKAGGGSITPDGKYLFYHQERHLYWVSTRLIEGLRPAEGR